MAKQISDSGKKKLIEKVKYLNKWIVVYVFSCIIMRCRKIRPTKEKTGNALVTVRIHVLHLP